MGGGTRKTQVKLLHTPRSKGETWCLDNWWQSWAMFHSFLLCHLPLLPSPVPYVYSFPFPYLTPSTQWDYVSSSRTFLGGGGSVASHPVPKDHIPFYSYLLFTPPLHPLSWQSPSSIVIQNRNSIKWEEKNREKNGRSTTNSSCLFAPYINIIHGTNYL